MATIAKLPFSPRSSSLSNLLYTAPFLCPPLPPSTFSFTNKKRVVISNSTPSLSNSDYRIENSKVIQLRCAQDVEKLIGGHKIDHKLIVINVKLKKCGPCDRVYPTVVALSRQMAGTTIFATMNEDENEGCARFLKEMGVARVLTFMFFRDGEVCGRYVGSCRSELVREIIQCQRLGKI